MIDSDHRPATIVATSVLTLSLMLGGVHAQASASAHNGILTAPAHPAAATPEPGLAVTLEQDGLDATYVTRAKTVTDFLTERGIVPGPSDLVTPSQQTALIDGMRVDYRAAVPVTLIIGRERRDILTASRDVASLLSAQNVALSPDDRVQPGPQESLHAGSVIRVSRESTWTVQSKQHIPPTVVHRYDPAIAPGATKTLAGSPGLMELTTRFVQRDDASLQAQVVATRIVRQPRPKVVLHGIGEYAAFAQIAQRGFDATLRLANSALRMVATAYTSGCAGCSGVTASGRLAGHGVVAVDPRIIPLGTKLFIPGYGHAVAGDTGGAIHGNRIDLGFNSLYDALQFGRRAITVYVLR